MDEDEEMGSDEEDGLDSISENDSNDNDNGNSALINIKTLLKIGSIYSYEIRF